MSISGHTISFIIAIQFLFIKNQLSMSIFYCKFNMLTNRQLENTLIIKQLFAINPNPNWNITKINFRDDWVLCLIRMLYSTYIQLNIMNAMMLRTLLDLNCFIIHCHFFTLTYFLLHVLSSYYKTYNILSIPKRTINRSILDISSIDTCIPACSLPFNT